MSLTYTPFADTPAVAALSRDLHMNVPDHERVFSGISGIALIGAALSRSGAGRWLFLLAGAALLRRGWTGHCAVYQSANVDRRHGSPLIPAE
jgi:uncharacterized membrane protein